MINKITVKQFDEWLEKCPIPYRQTDNGLNLTEVYEFNTSECGEDSDES